MLEVVKLFTVINALNNASTIYNETTEKMYQRIPHLLFT